MNFFNSIISFIEIAFNFLINTVQSLLNLFDVIRLTISIPGTFSGVLFAPLYTSLVVVVAVGVLFKIFGR